MTGLDNKRGFTLIELLIAMSIFIVMLTLVWGAMIENIKGQRGVFRKAKEIGTIDYALEYISRTLRTAIRDSQGTCVNANQSFLLTQGGKGVRFLNYKMKCQEIFFEDGELKVALSTDNNFSNLGTPFPLISRNFNLKDFKVLITGESSADELQPRVTFVLILPYATFQSTISQRNLDL